MTQIINTQIIYLLQDLFSYSEAIFFLGLFILFLFHFLFIWGWKWKDKLEENKRK